MSNDLSHLSSCHIIIDRFPFDSIASHFFGFITEGGGGLLFILGHIACLSSSCLALDGQQVTRGFTQAVHHVHALQLGTSVDE